MKYGKQLNVIAYDIVAFFAANARLSIEYNTICTQVTRFQDKLQ